METVMKSKKRKPQTRIAKARADQNLIIDEVLRRLQQDLRWRKADIDDRAESWKVVFANRMDERLSQFWNKVDDRLAQFLGTEVVVTVKEKARSRRAAKPTTKRRSRKK